MHSQAANNSSFGIAVSESQPCLRPISHIPVLQTRQKQKVNHLGKAKAYSNKNITNNNTEIKFHRKIKHHQPCLASNNGGRDNDLRKGYLGRKYLGFWTVNVFGRISPSTARKHCNQHLLKISFASWHLLWWELRQEWRLSVRAECHHRYMRMMETFEAWKNFLIVRTISRAKHTCALDFYHRRLCRKTMTHLVVYWRESRHRKQLCLKANTVYLTNLLRFSWITWLSALQHGHILCLKSGVALQFWEHGIEAKYWLAWRFAFEQKVSIGKKLAMADQHMNVTIVFRCFQLWLRYFRVRQSRNREKEYAHQVYLFHLKQRAIGRWRRCWRVRQATGRHADRIRLLAERIRLRQTLNRWQSYIDIVKHRKSVIILADCHYMEHLLYLGLNAFRLSIVQRHIKAMRQDLADWFKRKHTIGVAFLNWTRRMDDKEECELRLSTIKGREHYRRCLVAKAFLQLLGYREWRQRRKAQYVTAESFYYLQTAPHCLYRMKIFVRISSERRLNSYQASVFHRDHLLQTAFFTWRNGFQLAKDVGMMHRIAILHHEEIIKRTLLLQWKVSLARLQQQLWKEFDAQEHDKCRLKRMHVCAWHHYVEHLRRQGDIEGRAVHHYYVACIRRIMLSWKQFKDTRRRTRVLHALADGHVRRKLLQCSMSAWTRRLSHHHAATLTAQLHCAAHTCRRCLRSAFSIWREGIQCWKAERLHEARAGAHFYQLVLKKVVLTWHRFAVMHAYKKSQTSDMVIETRQHLNRCTLHAVLGRWLAAKDRSVGERLSCYRAVVHHHRRLQMSVIHHWRLYHSIVIRTQVLQAWHQQTASRRVKQQRVVMAMERRRLRLLRDGASQWLLVSDHLVQSKLARATEQQVAMISNISSRICRYFAHWRSWAARRASSHSHRTVSAHSTSSFIPYQTSLPQISLPCHPSICSDLRPILVTMAATSVSWTGYPIPAMSGASRSPKSSSAFVNGHGVDRRIVGDDVLPVHRRKPRHPQFLLESLQREGLLVQSPRSLCAVDQCSVERDRPDLDCVDTSSPCGNMDGSLDPISPAQSCGISKCCDTTTHVAGSAANDDYQPTSNLRRQATTGMANSPRVALIRSQPVNQLSAACIRCFLPSPHPAAKACLFKADTFGGLNDDECRGVAGGAAVRANSYLPPPPCLVLPPTVSSHLTVDVTLQDDDRGTAVVRRCDSPPSDFFLMRPEDFMKKRDGSTLHSDSPENNHHEQLATSSDAISTSAVSSNPSISSSTMSKLRRLGEEHDGSGDEFFGNAAGDQRVVPVRPAANPVKTCYPIVSSSSVSHELRAIRDHLSNFREQKSQLQLMEEQRGQMSLWLHEHSRSSPDDDIVATVTEELSVIDQEIVTLQNFMKSHKLSTRKMIKKAKTLTEQLGSKL